MKTTPSLTLAKTQTSIYLTLEAPTTVFYLHYHNEVTRLHRSVNTNIYFGIIYEEFGEIKWEPLLLLFAPTMDGNVTSGVTVKFYRVEP